MFRFFFIAGIWYVLLSVGPAMGQEGNNSAEGHWYRPVNHLFEKQAYTDLIAFYESRLPITIHSDSDFAALCKVAKAYYYTGRNIQAMDVYDTLIKHETKNLCLYREMLYHYSLLRIDIADYDKADTMLARAFSINPGTGVDSLSGYIYNARAILHMRNSRFMFALSNLDTALSMARSRKDQPLESFILSNYGILYRETGNYSASLRHYEASVEIDRKLKRHHDLATDYVNLGNLYNELNDFHKSLKYYEKARRLFETLGDSSGLGLIYGNMGITFRDLGKYKKAVEFLSRAFDLAKEQRDSIGMADWLYNLAMVYQERERKKAGIFFYEALSLSRRLKRINEESGILTDFGEFLLKTGNDDSAVTCFKAAYELLRTNGLNDYIWEPLYRLALYYRKTGNTARADSLFSEAVHSLDRHRSSIRVRQLTTHFLESERLKLYRNYAAFLIECNRISDAFHIIDRSKNRYLTDKLAERDSALVNSYSLSDSTALLEYCLLKDSWYVFVRTRDDLQCYSLCNDKELKKILSEYIVMTSNKHTPLKRIRQLGNELYLKIIHPVTQMNQYRQLFIVPDGILHHLPFETLWDGKRYLIEDYSVTYAPSYYFLGIRRRNPLVTGLPSLLIAKPYYNGRVNIYSDVPFEDLPHTQRERDSLMRIIPDAVTIKADEATVKSAAWDKISLAHFAVHAVHHEHQSEWSALILSPGFSEDGYLTSDEVAGLNIQTDLVTLSACATSKGPLLMSEGMLSLNRAFLAAGSQTVLSTLWNVYDESTAEFMIQFYRYRYNTGLRKNEALQATKCSFIRSDHYFHPAFWAGYVLWGHP